MWVGRPHKLLKMEEVQMYILTFVFMFVIGSILAACNGDWSGMKVIGKFVMGLIVFFLLALIVLNPILIVFVFFIALMMWLCNI